ncbi:MAG: hypothetical protein M1820_008364 [Bogoriella megaspora]|nr:MAG: hypothetical protein M1820_008364 [Bogoriella megaspora]
MSSWKKLAVLSSLAATASALPSRRSTSFCSKTDYQVISGTPWIVYNMLYNQDLMSSSDSWCTLYDSTDTSAAGVKEIKWGSTSSISSASDTVKGYSFIGLTQNLENTLSDIGSIPAQYSWARTNTTEFKGNIVFDFMTNDAKGDSTSTDSHELMLWLQYEGGQTPIGWNRGTPAYTVDSLFGTGWKLYEGKNEDTGITVSSLLPDTQFDGEFKGDLMDWFQVFVTRGTFKDSTYLNVGNAGTEIFYGDSTMNSTLSLQIDLAGSSSSEDTAAEAAISSIGSSATPSAATSASTVAAASSVTSVAAVATSESSSAAAPSSQASPLSSVARPSTTIPKPFNPITTASGSVPVVPIVTSTPVSSSTPAISAPSTLSTATSAAIPIESSKVAGAGFFPTWTVPTGGFAHPSGIAWPTGAAWPTGWHHHHHGGRPGSVPSPLRRG